MPWLLADGFTAWLMQLLGSLSQLTCVFHIVPEQYGIAVEAPDTLQCIHVQEKRKRDMGQAKKAKNYVEDEKRVARNYGMYSGFDN